MGMLCLTRRRHERIFIYHGDVRIIVTVNEFNGKEKVMLGFECPPEVKVMREEIAEEYEQQPGQRCPEPPRGVA